MPVLCYFDACLAIPKWSNWTATCVNHVNDTVVEWNSTPQYLPLTIENIESYGNKTECHQPFYPCWLRARLERRHPKAMAFTSWDKFDPFSSLSATFFQRFPELSDGSLAGKPRRALSRAMVHKRKSWGYSTGLTSKQYLKFACVNNQDSIYMYIRT